MIVLFNLENLLKVVDPDPVRLDPQACLVARHRNSHCRRCIEACPRSALRLEEGSVRVDAAACDRCGLCSGACPTAAVAVRGIDEAAVLAAGSVHCEKATGGGLRLPCLGYLSADHLLAMASRHPEVLLACGDCDACPRQSGGERAREAVALARAALSALGLHRTIRLTQQSGGGASGQSLSRRDLLGLWRTESAQVARQFLPEPELNHARLPARLPERRRRWIRQVGADRVPGGTMPGGPWAARRVTDACTGCGICARFCPTGALADGGADGTWELTHQPAACVACGTCAELCPVRAVGEEPLSVQALAGGDRKALITLAARACRTCRRTFKGRPEDDQCPNCRNSVWFA
ncbi:ferredoxin [Symbiobacterium terraclitae]|uniref:Ferredoxin n=1 Tax=Symbiobacterium terraclitae TaxID=557451 RepID=A0ABS4JRC0_9FIRM|nr:ferredoxin [Symbiobacterium terraclitae]